MPKSKRKAAVTSAPATKADVENAIDRLARVTEKAFQKVVTKDEAKQFLTKEDAKQFATKKDLQASEKRILDGVKTLMEVRDGELEGKHEVELERVAGKTDTPPAWKPIPRRLKTVEQDVEHIKDHLHLPSK